MRVGLVGCGNMGSALARGWGQPVCCCDVVPGLAERLADDTGGEAFTTNAALAENSDLVVLCHKPFQLQDVAEQMQGKARAVASILAGISLTELEAKFPNTPVIRLMPNTAVEVGRGVICYVRGTHVSDELATQALDLFGRSARLFEVQENLIDAAMALIGVAPAYVALVAEAWIDAGVAHGIPATQAGELVAEGIAGSAELLLAQGVDTLAVRRGVTTPGGVTAEGLAALEAAGVRAAFREATDAVLDHVK